MLLSLSVRGIVTALFVCAAINIGFAESIVLESSAVNTIQIKALEQSGVKVFEIQLGGGSNQPPANTWITGKASTIVGQKKYSGYYRLSTAPEHQLKMRFKAAAKGTDEYTFVAGDDVVYFEFAPTSSFSNPWLTGRMAVTSARQQLRDAGKRKKSNQNGNQNGSNGNDGNQHGGQNGDDGGQDGDEHPPIALIGEMGSPTGGSLAKLFSSGESQLLLNVGGNQQLSVLQRDNTHSGMSLQQGSISFDRQ